MTKLKDKFNTEAKYPNQAVTITDFEQMVTLNCFTLMEYYILPYRNKLTDRIEELTDSVEIDLENLSHELYQHLWETMPRPVTSWHTWVSEDGKTVESNG